MKNDTSELTNKIMREHESIAAFCEAAGICNPAEFEQELSEGDLSVEHIEKTAQALSISPEEIDFYFFRPAPVPTTEEIYKIYAQLTPENQKKFREKVYSLLIEEGKLFHIKANLQTDPIEANAAEEQQSYGEGVFMLVYADAKQAYDNDETGTIYPAILDNDSIEYSGLIHGTRVPLVMNGRLKPYVPFDWLIEHYTKA